MYYKAAVRHCRGFAIRQSIVWSERRRNAPNTQNESTGMYSKRMSRAYVYTQRMVQTVNKTRLVSHRSFEPTLS